MAKAVITIEDTEGGEISVSMKITPAEVCLSAPTKGQALALKLQELIKSECGRGHPTFERVELVNGVSKSLIEDSHARP